MAVPEPPPAPWLRYPKDNCVSMNTTMVKKKCLDNVGGFSETVRVADDYDLVHRVLLRNGLLSR